MFSKLRRLGTLIKYRHHLLEVAENYKMFAHDPENATWGTLSDADEEGIKIAIELSRSAEGPIVEIGTLFGQTTNLIASLKDPEKPLITVDNYCWNPFSLRPRAHRRFTKRVLRLAIDRCNTSIHEGSSQDFFAKYSGAVPAMIFIDGDHHYGAVLRDIRDAIGTGCAIISGHDYADKFPEVRRAVDECFGDRISVQGTVWVASAIKQSTVPEN